MANNTQRGLLDQLTDSTTQTPALPAALSPAAAGVQTLALPPVLAPATAGTGADVSPLAPPLSLAGAPASTVDSSPTNTTSPSLAPQPNTAATRRAIVGTAPALRSDNTTTTGSTANLESLANSPDTMMGRISAAAQTEKNDNPSFLTRLGRIAGGAVGFTDPDSSSQADLGSRIGSLVGRIGTGLAMAEGTPEQKEIAGTLPLKLAQLQSEQEFRKAMVGNAANKTNLQYGAGNNGQPEGTSRIGAEARQQQADQAQQKAQGSMRLRGYVPDEKTPGAYRPMNEDEIIADPILSQNRDLLSTAIASKNAGIALAQARVDALMNPNNPTLELKRQQIENQYRLAQGMLGMRMHTQARQDQAFLYDYGQTPGGAPSPSTFGPPSGEPGQAQAQPGGLSLNNAPDMMMVNPTTGLPIPMKMLSTLKPTMQEQNRADFAASAMHSADKIQQLVDQAKAQVGPFSGRTAELMAKAGLGDQFNQELQNYVRFTQSAATAAHTGRFSVPILDKMDKMIGPEMNPDQLSGAIDSIKSQMTPYADTGWKPTVWEYRAWLGGAGTTPSGKKATPNSPGTSDKLTPAQYLAQKKAGK